jgi:hypothetical protein
MAKETKTLSEPLAYWPDDKSTNIVCDETYNVLREDKEILIRGKARDSAASLLSYLCELPYDSDVEKAIEKVNEVIDFVLGIRDESI